MFSYRMLRYVAGKTRDILVAYRPALEELAKLLLEKEVVDRPALQAILKVRSLDRVKDKKRAVDATGVDGTRCNADRE